MGLAQNKPCAIMTSGTGPTTFLWALLLLSGPVAFAQATSFAGLPEAPRPQLPVIPLPCSQAICQPRASTPAEARMCCARTDLHEAPSIYLTPPGLSPREKFDLAWREFIDPFNLLTIAGEAAITTASDSHSAYGPGMAGFGRYVGVSASQSAVENFLGVFLIPSLAHQDPHYFREPNLPVSRRIEHVFAAVVIGHADNGRPMFNYSRVFSTIGTSVVGDTYVPGRKIGPEATTARIAVALATTPIGNAVAEFLPDVARHININVVLVQRVINRVATVRGTAAGP